MSVKLLLVAAVAAAAAAGAVEAAVTVMKTVGMTAPGCAALPVLDGADLSLAAAAAAAIATTGVN